LYNNGDVNASFTTQAHTHTAYFLIDSSLFAFCGQASSFVVPPPSEFLFCFFLFCLFTPDMATTLSTVMRELDDMRKSSATTATRPSRATVVALPVDRTSVASSEPFRVEVLNTGEYGDGYGYEDAIKGPAGEGEQEEEEVNEKKGRSCWAWTRKPMALFYLFLAVLIAAGIAAGVSVGVLKATQDNRDLAASPSPEPPMSSTPGSQSSNLIFPSSSSVGMSSDNLDSLGVTPTSVSPTSDSATGPISTMTSESIGTLNTDTTTSTSTSKHSNTDLPLILD
jgi:hypothetical protein